VADADALAARPASMTFPALVISIVITLSLFSLRWRRRHPVVTADAVLLLSVCLSVFRLLFPLSHRSLRSLLFPGNKRDRRDTLTQCAEWSQFAVGLFVSEIWAKIENK